MKKNRSYAILNSIIINPVSNNQYTLIKYLGKGSFAQVYQIQEIQSKKIFACKVMQLSMIKQLNRYEQLENEIQLYNHLKHENICELIENFTDQDNHYFILEFCNYQSMQELKYPKQSQIQQLTQQIIQALTYLKQNQIVHRDLKPHNIFLDKQTIFMNVKLGDFSIAMYCNESNDKVCCKLCGTPNFMSPEQIITHIKLSQQYNSKIDSNIDKELITMVNKIQINPQISYQSDMWALGCIIYQLFTGIPPFQADNITSTFKRILLGQFPALENQHANDFVSKCLVADPNQRLTVEQAQSHAYVLDNILSSRTLLPNLSEVQQSDSKNTMHHLKNLFQDYKFNDQVVNFDQTGIIPTVQNLVKLVNTPQTFIHFDASLDPYDYLIASTQYRPQYYALKYPYVIKMSQNLFVLSTGQCGILFTAGQLISSANGILFDFIGDQIQRFDYEQAFTLFPAETALLQQFRLKNKFSITDCLDQFVPPSVYESNVHLINDRFKFNSLQIYQLINNYIQKLSKDEQLKQKAKRSLTEQVLKFAGSIQPFISVQDQKIFIHSSSGVYQQITNPNLTKMIKGEGVVVLVNEKGVRVVVERFE
ncbi:Serine/threonine-protein_kinase PLK [Hexamita inflata]|uniref:Serine/threonine-protein kinase PLK n=1 Tax=Hexamita inflata TaxID=28002 RepID=A0AA86NAW8_9EUKA|nr:Serine/threonine-protein kinase PLK [Hexamita inflata]